MKWAEGIDKLGIFLYLAISLFAIANIYSVDEGLGTKQFIFFGISLVVGLVIFTMRTKFFENFAGIFFILGILSLAGLHVFGTEILGQKNWYKFGGFTMQPVEFAKIGTALMLANYVSGPDFNLKMRKSQLTVLAIIGVPALVVLSIPDVGSLLVFTAFAIALYREGLNGWLFIVGFVLAAVFLLSIAFNPILISLYILLLTLTLYFFIVYNISVNIFSILSTALILFFSYFLITSQPLITFIILLIISIVLTISFLRNNGSLLVVILGVVINVILAGISFGTPKIMEKLPNHQRERIEVLYKGEKAFRDTSGYNLLYSKTAIGSGGFWGKGYKQGSVTQGKFVPEQETDYIFCTVGEEWGFFGSFLLVLFYAIYIGRIFYLAETQKNTFNRVFGYCFAGILLMHFSINLGMVMGLFPTVGIPLPYFSYGGSSLLAFSIMTAIFFKLNYADKNSLV